jgi:uncharacterized protein with FMN-binding domain
MTSPYQLTPTIDPAASTTAEPASAARPRRRLAGSLALAGLGATLLSAPGTPAVAAANPGQSIYCDYGQSDVEVAAEITAQVEGNPAVVAARNLVTSRHAATVARRTAEGKAKTAYVAAVRSKVRVRILRTRKTYVAAHAASVKAAAAESSARTALASLRAAKTAAVRKLHYRPVDGVWTGAQMSYLVPSDPISFEPMQVRITVYGGHVSDIVVTKQADPASSSAYYNNKSLSTLMLEAMQAHDTANVAAVSGASLTSEAFQQSLTAALTAAGFKV